MSSSSTRSDGTPGEQTPGGQTHHAPPHLHAGGGAVSRKRTIVLAGNPNVGKSVVFNYLSGMYVDVSNFPGTTVELSRASYLDCDVIDTPGIYGVSSFNDEEAVARDVILEADVVLNVVDAVHLERDLFLTQQLIDMGKRVCVVVNMLDEARAQRLTVDIPALEAALGVPAVGCVATRREGLDRVHELIARAREGAQHPPLHARLHAMLSTVASQAEALLVAEGDPVVAARHGVAPAPAAEREALYIDRRNRVNRILESVVTDAHGGARLSAAVGRLSVSPVFGIPVLAAVLYAVYLFVGVLVARELVDITEHDIGRDIVEFHVKSWIARHAAVVVTVHADELRSTAPGARAFVFERGVAADPARWTDARHAAGEPGMSADFRFRNPWLTLFFGEFGAVTMTFTYLVFLLLPLVAGFYFALSVLEDSGYLPRLATLVDRLLRGVGLNGRAIIPLILGFGCVTMATITTRLLATQREKTIATTILQLAIPCSAQLGVIAALLAGAGTTATLVYTAVILVFLVAVGTAMNRLMPGSASPLLLDLPPMRLPRLQNVLQKTTVKTFFFMKEATPWFFIGALAVGILHATGALVAVQDALQPVVVTWLRLPKEAATAFVMGLVRRDFGAAGLYSMHLTPFQTVAALVTITLFVPCVASLMVMLKERGWKEGLLIWCGSLILAVGIGGIVATVLIP